MRKKTITVESIDLFYVEINESTTQTIFFIHGISGSYKTWELQLNDPLLSRFRLIAFDLPGHGNSSITKEPENDYSPLGTAKILAKAIVQLAADVEFILIGFSYGTNLIAEMVNIGLLPRGIVAIGMCCIGQEYGMDKVFRQNETPSVYLYNENNREVVQEFHWHMVANKPKIDILVNDYFKTDLQFKPSFTQAASDGLISDEVEVLRKLNVPACVVFGKKDTLINVDYLDELPFRVWKNNIIKLENTGHWVHLDDPETLNGIIDEYTKEFFK